MSLMYMILFIISLGMMVTLIAQFRDKISTYYVLMFSTVLISCFGYMQMSSAQNLQMAVYANQTIYLGACFSPFFMVMCMADLCKIKIKSVYQLAMILLGVVIFTFISTIGTFNWYYKNVSFEIVDGIGRLKKEYGPLHTLYPLYLLLAVAMGITMIIHSIRKKRDVSYTTSILLLIIMSMTVVDYIIEKLLHMDMSILPLTYVICQIMILFLLNRISLYGVSSITADLMVESLSYGFVLFDTKGRYLGCDAAAKEWFPEINEIKIESRLKNENTEFLKQAGLWIRNEAESDITHFKSGHYYVEAKHFLTTSDSKRKVHCIYLRDDTAQYEYTKLVEQYNKNLERDVNRKTHKLSRIQNDIIISMASIVENRDNNTGGHIARTSDIVRIFVNHLMEYDKCEELTEHVADCIIKAAPLHDFGKIAIPDVILNKPGRFTDEEYNEMKKHSEKGAVIVARILFHSDDEVFKKIAVNVAHYHHEKWDGTGYPKGIKENEIPFEARVMALADVFDALVSKRVYKESMSYDKAFKIIEESCGTHFDPLLCTEFLHCRKELEELYNSYDD